MSQFTHHRQDTLQELLMKGLDTSGHRTRSGTRSGTPNDAEKTCAVQQTHNENYHPTVGDTTRHWQTLTDTRTCHRTPIVSRKLPKTPVDTYGQQKTPTDTCGQQDTSMGVGRHLEKAEEPYGWQQITADTRTPRRTSVDTWRRQNVSKTTC